MRAPWQLYLATADLHNVSETAQNALDTNFLSKQKGNGWVITHLQISGFWVIFLNPRGQTMAAEAAQDVQGVLWRTVMGASQRLETAWNDKKKACAGGGGGGGGRERGVCGGGGGGAWP